MSFLVSVVIPVYNAEKYLDTCIQSVMNQTWPNTEIILIDDGSTDNSLKVAQKYQENANVKIIAQKNKGAAAARNAGLKLAKGDYIQFLDADDLLSPDKIEGQITRLNGSLKQVAICRAVHFNDGDNYEDGIISDGWFCSDNNTPADFLIKLYAGNEIMPGYGGIMLIHSWLTPMAIIQKAGLWNEKLSLDDDGEFFCRVVLAADGIKYSEKGFSYYRKFNNGQSLSAQKSRAGAESGVLAIDLKYQNLKAKTNNPIIDRVFARHYRWIGVLAYPQFKSLSSYCIKKAQELGYNGEKYTGGPAGHFLTKLMGWKAARILAYYKQLVSKSWA